MHTTISNCLLINIIVCGIIAKSFAQEFQFLGNFSRKGHRLATYFISVNEANAEEALEICNHMFIGGRLLTIFTKEEDEYIRLRLQIAGIGAKNEYVLSGGRYNGVLGKWEWTYGGLPFLYDHWIGGNPPAGTGCMQVVGELSSYGWASVSCTNRHKFICQF